MIFGIITHAVHKIKDGQIYAYEPYVREMNLWGKYVDEIIIVAPVSINEIRSIDASYSNSNIKLIAIPNFDITSIKNIIRSILVIPKICDSIYKVMKQVNHIHLRCPGNVGILGCIVQVFFPLKSKTAKYAGNWDPKSKQPITYRLQKWILRNTFLTKNMQVLVYGEWETSTKNIKPFFTASYFEKDKIDVKPRKLEGKISFLFVGTLQPACALRKCQC